ncbi:serine carboxypeptidase II-2-like [Rhododendron vialii]|uniref:serine carboxypeptidase II-2-like n=1 Tax=Rhododendron vialii TaxID=182163 RepID=UPI00265F729E|nr:serine carboxypeptidase II-2-like [Rhododendron vialii]
MGYLQFCSVVVDLNWKDSPTSVLHSYHELIQSGVRIFIFSGDIDSVIPVTSTGYCVNALNLPTVGPWRTWFDDGQVQTFPQELLFGFHFLILCSKSKSK